MENMAELCLNFFSRAGGSRTHKVSLPEDFKSPASANSATAPLDPNSTQNWFLVKVQEA